MFRLQSITIARRMGLLLAGSILGIALLAAVLLWTERTLVLEERQLGVQQAVEGAHSLIVHFHNQAATGKMPETEAQQRAQAAIRSMRYSGAEYFWINDMQPKMVMHPIRPELEGKDLSDNKDPTGQRLFVEFVHTVKAKGAGFVMYLWPKPGSDKPVQKVSYVKGFEPWGWIVGSGVYLDNVDTTISGRFVNAGLGTLALAALLLAISVLITRSILRQLGGEPGDAAHITNRIADGDLTVDIVLRPEDNSSLLHSIQSGVSSFSVQ